MKLRPERVLGTGLEDLTRPLRDGAVRQTTGTIR